jgi:hypothetical protein
MRNGHIFVAAALVAAICAIACTLFIENGSHKGCHYTRYGHTFVAAPFVGAKALHPLSAS